MRSLSHLSPRYVTNRLKLRAYERSNPDAPWLTQDMISILDNWLLPGDTGLEWGSGRSTAWIASRIGHLTAVECDGKWSKRVKKMLLEKGLMGKVSYHPIPVTGYDPASEETYVKVADGLQPESLDFCLVDGDLRDACAEAILGKIKPGGGLVVDNVERYIPRERKSSSPNARSMADGYESETWKKVHGRLREWRCIWTSNGITDTALWVKPV